MTTTILSFDTETKLISPGRQAPDMACLTYAFHTGGRETGILHWTQAYQFMGDYLSSGATFVGANTPYDMLVTWAQFPILAPLIFQAYEEDRVQDVQTRQKLIDIASGCFRGYLNTKFIWVPLKYSLEDLTRRHTDRQLDKDTWRLRYGELRDYPVEYWPQGAIDYAMGDSISTRDIQENQEIQAAGSGVLEDQFRQTRGDWFLKLGSCWGLRTDAAAVDRLEAETVKLYNTREAELIAAGLVKVKDIGGKNPRQERTRNTKAAKALMLQVCGWVQVEEGKGKNGTNFQPTRPDSKPLVLTEGGDVALGQEPCDDTGDPILGKYGEFGGLKTLISKDITALRSGVMYPIHTRYDTAASGRSTSSGPNIQNWRRLPGIREAFRPRPGHVFLQADVGGLELATLAETCMVVLGWSTLAVALNAGTDVHTALAAKILNWTYEQAREVQKTGKSHPAWDMFDDARQAAKVANFGFPGGLGAVSFVEYAKANYGVIVTVERARELKEQWLAQWPEMTEYFAWINAHMTNPDGTGQIRQIYSNRIRGMCSYTQACNSFFQGLGADVMKHVGFKLVKACYITPGSPIYGGRPVVFAHDENIVEYPEGPGMHEAAMELTRITEEEARPWLPHVAIKAPPVIMRYWSKKAEAVYSQDGRLGVWEGKQAA